MSVIYTMRNTYVPILAIALAVFGVLAYLYYYEGSEQAAPQLQGQMETYSNNEIGVEFKYRSGAEGYVVQEMPQTDDTGPIRTIMLMRTADAQTPPPVGGEGPPSITLQVFKNKKKQWALSWADENSPYSNMNLRQGDVGETNVGDSNAITYKVDGLYAMEVVVVPHGSHMYVFSGAYMEENSDLRRDFRPLLESVKFIPETGQPTGTSSPAGKININAVCEGALIYMTFENGAAADRFVADCKAGKHPEVIERYKEDLGLDDAVI